MLIGYARVSTTDQTLDLQLDALKKAGCTKTFTDTVSGGAAECPGLADAFSHLRDGDTLVVWRLDRLGRSLTHLIETVTKLHSQGIGFKSLTEQIDTTTSGGKLIFQYACGQDPQRSSNETGTVGGWRSTRTRSTKRCWRSSI
jgi:DNA invertase Pin-like site-specific DNA recombinase